MDRVNGNRFYERPLYDDNKERREMETAFEFCDGTELSCNEPPLNLIQPLGCSSQSGEEASAEPSIRRGEGQ